MGFEIHLIDEWGGFTVFVRGAIGCCGIGGPVTEPPGKGRRVMVVTPTIPPDGFEIVEDAAEDAG